VTTVASLSDARRLVFAHPHFEGLMNRDVISKLLIFGHPVGKEGIYSNLSSCHVTLKIFKGPVHQVWIWTSSPATILVVYSPLSPYHILVLLLPIFPNVYPLTTVSLLEEKTLSPGFV
jgi:hypothetical protein